MGVDLLQADRRVVGGRSRAPSSAAVGAIGAVPSSQSGPVWVCAGRGTRPRRQDGVLGGRTPGRPARREDPEPRRRAVGVEVAVLRGGLGRGAITMNRCGAASPRSATRPGRPACGGTSSLSAWLVPSRWRQILSARHGTLSVVVVVGSWPLRLQVAPPSTPVILSSSSTGGRSGRSLIRTVKRSSPGRVVDRQAGGCPGLTEEPPSETNSWPSASSLTSRSSCSPGRAGWSGTQSSSGSRGSPVVVAVDSGPAGGAVLLALVGAGHPGAAVARRHREVGLAGAGLDLLEMVSRSRRGGRPAAWRRHSPRASR